MLSSDGFHAQLEESSSAQTKQGPRRDPNTLRTVAIPSLNLSPEEHEPLTTSLLAVFNSKSNSNSSLSLSLLWFPLWSKTWLVTSIGTRWNKCSKYLAVVAKTEVARTRGKRHRQSIQSILKSASLYQFPPMCSAFHQGCYALFRLQTKIRFGANQRPCLISTELGAPGEGHHLFEPFGACSTELSQAFGTLIKVVRVPSYTDIGAKHHPQEFPSVKISTKWTWNKSRANTTRHVFHRPRGSSFEATSHGLRTETVLGSEKDVVAICRND